MITILATGGTIASVAGETGRHVGVTGSDLLAKARQGWTLPDRIEPIDVGGLISSALSTADVLSLARRIHRNHQHPVVITHGTDAMEETACALALTRSHNDAPIVLTGSQRPFDDPSPDGPRNLGAALLWAASPLAANTGVTVVFADQVFPAIGVRKTHTLALDGFSAPGRGPFATVDEAGVRKFYHPQLPDALLAPEIESLPQVHIIGSYLAMTSDLLELALQAPQPALVVEAMGSGNMPPIVTRRLVEALREGVPVVVTSRTGSGATAGLYAGGGADLASAGAIFAGDLSAVQARLALAAALIEPDLWRERLLTWLAGSGAISNG